MKMYHGAAGLFVRFAGLALACSVLPGIGSSAEARQPRTPGSPTTPVKPAPTPGTPANTPKSSTPAANSPAQPSARERTKEPTVGPFIKLTQTKELNLTARVRVLRGNEEQQINDPINGTSVTVSKTVPFDPMKTIAMIWPMLPASGSATPHVEGITGKLLLDDAVAATTFTVMKNYQGGVQYARFDAVATNGDLTPKKVELEVIVPVSVSRTEFDEKAALALPWPKAWPKDAASWLQPQLFVESGFDEHNKITLYKEDAIVAALKMAGDKAGVSDWKGISPVAAAKIITSFVWGHVQIVTNTVARGGVSGEIPPMRLSKGDTFGTSDIGGIVVQTPQSTLDSKRGTEYDASALLTAMLKKAGIPAHPVVGYDRGSSGGSNSRNELTGKSNRGTNKGTKCWVEFALFDEANNTINWVPIDIGKLNKTSSRPSAVEKPWRYFGTHDELNSVAPIAYHFFPPTDVVSYGASGFWGWFVTPQAPKSAGQAISFSVAAASTRGVDGSTPTTPAKDDSETDKDKRDDDKKKKRGY